MTDIKEWLPVDVQGFQLGYRMGAASRDAEVEALRATADYWYFIANNPGEVARRRDELLSAFDVAAARARTRAWWSVLDAQEKQRQGDLDTRAGVV